MVLFTKEVFLQLKTLIDMHINVQHETTFDKDNNCVRVDTWQVYIQGIIDNVPTHSEVFQQYISVSSKEDAYRLYKELTQQIVDSGEIPILSTKLLDDVLKEK